MTGAATSYLTLGKARGLWMVQIVTTGTHKPVSTTAASYADRDKAVAHAKSMAEVTGYSFREGGGR